MQQLGPSRDFSAFPQSWPRNRSPSQCYAWFSDLLGRPLQVRVPAEPDTWCDLSPPRANHVSLPMPSWGSYSSGIQTLPGQTSADLPTDSPCQPHAAPSALHARPASPALPSSLPCELVLLRQNPAQISLLLKAFPEVTASWNKLVLAPWRHLWGLCAHYRSMTVQGWRPCFPHIGVSGVQSQWSSRVYGTDQNPGHFCR